MLLTWLMLAGLILLFLPPRTTNKFHFAFVRFFRLPLSIGRSISLSAATTNRSPIDVVSRDEYIRLKNHSENLRAQLHEEHQKFEKLAGLHSRLPLEGAKLVLADVATTSADGLMTINRGKSDGLTEGQFILGDNSVIGTIADISSRQARVKLITNSALAIPVRIETPDGYIRGVMQGNGKARARIQMLQRKHKIKTNSAVYACKKVGFLDAPIIVGRVAQCRVDDTNPLLWDITVRPVCTFEQLSSVAVIVMNPGNKD